MVMRSRLKACPTTWAAEVETHETHSDNAADHHRRSDLLLGGWSRSRGGLTLQGSAALHDSFQLSKDS